MSLLQLLCILVTLSAACMGAPRAQTEYINTSSYLVSIQNYLFDNRHECAGAILSKNWVVTAAHCAGITLLTSKIVAGDFGLEATRASQNLQTRDIDFYQVIIHPDYNVDLINNDIALLRVTEPFEFNEYVQPLQISKVGCYALDEPNVFSTWKTDISAERSFFENANVSIVDFDSCSETFYAIYGDNLPLNRDMHVCVTGTSSPCIADSGGPLVQDDRLIGLLSWLSASCINSDVPAVFTKTGHYKNFIEQYVDDLM